MARGRRGWPPRSPAGWLTGSLTGPGWPNWPPCRTQIAAQLYISVRTVGSHLDRIRDKTGARRRADLTRLALTADDLQPRPVQAEISQLSTRERELVTLVAQGRTDAQIAGQLYIAVSTVRSHLDRIRDKTGCRRRADLTRLAQSAGLV